MMSFINVQQMKEWLILKSCVILGLPWLLSGLDSTTPMQGAQVPPLVRNHPTCYGMQPKKKKKSYFCHVDIAGIPLPQNLSGYSLLPSASEMFKKEQKLKNLHPPWILSEFHGCNVNASTYMLRTNQWKYIAYSDGASILPQLFGKFADIIF